MDVLKVNTLNVRTKIKRSRGPGIIVHDFCNRSDFCSGKVKKIPRYKKAYVTVSPADVSQEMTKRLSKMRPIRKRGLPPPEAAEPRHKPEWFSNVLKRIEAN